MYDDETDPRSADLPRPVLSKGAVALAALAAIGFGTVVGGLYLLVARLF